MKTFLCIVKSLFPPPSKLNPKRKEFGEYVNQLKWEENFLREKTNKKKQSLSLQYNYLKRKYLNVSVQDEKSFVHP